MVNGHFYKRFFILLLLLLLFLLLLLHRTKEATFFALKIPKEKKSHLAYKQHHNFILWKQTMFMSNIFWNISYRALKSIILGNVENETVN